MRLLMHGFHIPFRFWSWQNGIKIGVRKLSIAFFLIIIGM